MVYYGSKLSGIRNCTPVACYLNEKRHIPHVLHRLQGQIACYTIRRDNHGVEITPYEPNFMETEIAKNGSEFLISGHATETRNSEKQNRD
jgi:hypothetical protein